MEYVATRDGVEIIQSTESATKKQKQFIKRLLKDFPDAKALFEYSDYLQTPNRETASAFIAAALDTHLHEVESESGYMSYIAQRPRAEKHGGHGLFSEADTTDLKAAKAELKAHKGKVWTFIFSLRREDAERLGYNKAAAWQNLLKQESAAIAEAMRIRTDDLRWYAAYHDEGHHPHVHMMVWSTEPERGYLTREGIAAMRSKMTNAIFHEEMRELYIKKDAAYKESIQTAKESLLLYIRMLENSESADPVIEQKLCDLSHALEQVDGKHVYAYPYVWVYDTTKADTTKAEKMPQLGRSSGTMAVANELKLTKPDNQPEGVVVTLGNDSDKKTLTDAAGNQYYYAASGYPNGVSDVPVTFTAPTGYQIVFTPATTKVDRKD